MKNNFQEVAWVFGSEGLLGSALVEILESLGYHVEKFVKNYSYNSMVGKRVLDLNNSLQVSAFISNIKVENNLPKLVFFAARGDLVFDKDLAKEFSTDYIFSDYLISVVNPIRIVLGLHEVVCQPTSVVFYSSQYAFRSQPRWIYSDPDTSISTLYSAIKSSIVGAVKNLAIECASKELYVNTHTLGGIFESASKDLSEIIESLLPTRKMLRVHDVALSSIQLAEMAPRGFVGTNITMDMGWELR